MQKSTHGSSWVLVPSVWSHGCDIAGVCDSIILEPLTLTLSANCKSTTFQYNSRAWRREPPRHSSWSSYIIGDLIVHIQGFLEPLSFFWWILSFRGSRKMKDSVVKAWL